jgi:anaerobic selenocysteine-containing dehydrogenase
MSAINRRGFVRAALPAAILPAAGAAPSTPPRPVNILTEFLPPDRLACPDCGHAKDLEVELLSRGRVHLDDNGHPASAAEAADPQPAWHPGVSVITCPACRFQGCLDEFFVRG